MVKRVRAFAVLVAILAAASFGHTLSGQSAAQVADDFSALHFRSIGPAQASGRVSDIAVYEANPATF